MSRWEVGVKSGQNYTNVLEVEGVSHITSYGNDARTDHPVEVSFFSKKKGTNPTNNAQEYKTLLAVPYSELVYYKRLPKKGKKNG